jgi:hypothetical protein
MLIEVPLMIYVDCVKTRIKREEKEKRNARKSP